MTELKSNLLDKAALCVSIVDTEFPELSAIEKEKKSLHYMNFPLEYLQEKKSKVNQVLFFPHWNNETIIRNVIQMRESWVFMRRGKVHSLVNFSNKVFPSDTFNSNDSFILAQDLTQKDQVYVLKMYLFIEDNVPFSKENWTLVVSEETPNILNPSGSHSVSFSFKVTKTKEFLLKNEIDSLFEKGRILIHENCSNLIHSLNTTTVDPWNPSTWVKDGYLNCLFGGVRAVQKVLGGSTC